MREQRRSPHSSLPERIRAGIALRSRLRLSSLAAAAWTMAALTSGSLTMRHKATYSQASWFPGTTRAGRWRHNVDRQGATAWSGTIALTAGIQCYLKIESYESARSLLGPSCAGQRFDARQLIPAGQLSLTPLEPAGGS